MNLERIIRDIGETGKIIYEKNASEGSAGNISFFFREDFRGYIEENFTVKEEINLSFSSENLVGGFVIITGSGTRLREIYDYPFENLAVVEIISKEKGIMHSSPERIFIRPTVEFNSHLAIHNICNEKYHALVHAQPLFLTHLSHYEKYNNFEYFNKRLLRWEVETIVNMPHGIGIVPFAQPGSEKLLNANVELCKKHNIILWQKHGVIARSNCVKKAWDLIEFAETAAKHEFLNSIVNVEVSGIESEKIREVMNNLNISQSIF